MNSSVRVYYAIWLAFGMAMGVLAFLVISNAPR